MFRIGLALSRMVEGSSPSVVLASIYCFMFDRQSMSSSGTLSFRTRVPLPDQGRGFDRASKFDSVEGHSDHATLASLKGWPNSLRLLVIIIL